MVSAGFLAGAAAVFSTLVAQTATPDLTPFLRSYDDAWALHDAHALALLHTEDVLVVNRFGSMLDGRAELKQAMQFLHGPGGPFHAVTFPRQQLLLSRMLDTSMATLHAKWKNPTMGLRVVWFRAFKSSVKPDLAVGDVSLFLLAFTMRDVIPFGEAPKLRGGTAAV